MSAAIVGPSGSFSEFFDSSEEAKRLYDLFVRTRKCDSDDPFLAQGSSRETNIPENLCDNFGRARALYQKILYEQALEHECVKLYRLNEMAPPWIAKSIKEERDFLIKCEHEKQLDERTTILSSAVSSQYVYSLFAYR